MLREFLYIVELNSHRVRRVTPDGIIRTVAGSVSIGGGVGVFSGDGGRATAARLNAPFHIAVRDDTLYIADSGNHRVRVVTPDGIIRTAAVNGEAGYSGDRGAAVDASFKPPSALAFAPDGSLYIVDADNNVVRQVDQRAVSSAQWRGNDSIQPFGCGRGDTCCRILQANQAKSSLNWPMY